MQIKLIKTIKGKHPMAEDNNICFNNDVYVENNVINIIPDIEYQIIEGFGGAFTEAAAVTWQRLGQENQKRF